MNRQHAITCRISPVRVTVYVMIALFGGFLLAFAVKAAQAPSQFEDVGLYSLRLKVTHLECHLWAFRISAMLFLFDVLSGYRRAKTEEGHAK